MRTSTARSYAAVLLCAAFCACATRGHAPARTAPQTAAQKKEAPRKISEEDLKKAERLYYKAVGAYSDNDMGRASKYLDEIRALAPAYAPAAELREKIRKVSSGSGRP